MRRRAMLAASCAAIVCAAAGCTVTVGQPEPQRTITVVAEDGDDALRLAVEQEIARRRLRSPRGARWMVLVGRTIAASGAGMLNGRLVDVGTSATLQAVNIPTTGRTRTVESLVPVLVERLFRR